MNDTQFAQIATMLGKAKQSNPMVGTVIAHNGRVLPVVSLRYDDGTYTGSAIRFNGPQPCTAEVTRQNKDLYQVRNPIDNSVFEIESAQFENLRRSVYR